MQITLPIQPIWPIVFAVTAKGIEQLATFGKKKGLQGESCKSVFVSL
jgi:hypothetical protein